MVVVMIVIMVMMVIVIRGEGSGMLALGSGPGWHGAAPLPSDRACGVVRLSERRSGSPVGGGLQIDRRAFFFVIAIPAIASLRHGPITHSPLPTTMEEMVVLRLIRSEIGAATEEKRVVGSNDLGPLLALSGHRCRG
jgi:hypothetical protein